MAVIFFWLTKSLSFKLLLTMQTKQFFLCWLLTVSLFQPPQMFQYTMSTVSQGKYPRNKGKCSIFRSSPVSLWFYLICCFHFSASKINVLSTLVKSMKSTWVNRVLTLEPFSWTLNCAFTTVSVPRVQWHQLLNLKTSHCICMFDV